MHVPSILPYMADQNETIRILKELFNFENGRVGFIQTSLSKKKLIKRLLKLAIKLIEPPLYPTGPHRECFKFALRCTLYTASASDIALDEAVNEAFDYFS